MTNRIKRFWWVQDALEDLETTVFAFSAGLGSGKTHGVCELHHDRVMKNIKSPFSAFMMPIYQKIHDAAIPTYKKILENYGFVESQHFHIVKTPYPKLIYKNGHEVHFISANRPDKIVAVEYSHLSISECAVTPEDAFKLARTRVRCGRAQVRQTFCEGIGEGGNWWMETFCHEVNDEWEEVKPKRIWKLKRKSELVKSNIVYKRYRLRTPENPFLPDDYVDNLYDLYGHNQNYIDVYVEGHFRELVSGSVYSEYKSIVHDMTDIDVESSTEIFLTWDFNANPLAWIAAQQRWYWDFTERKSMLVALGESSLDNTQLTDACAEFAAKYPVERFARTPIRIFGDSSGYAKSHKVAQNDYQQVEEILRRMGYRNIYVEALRYNPRETDSVAAVNNAFQEKKLFIKSDLKNLKNSLLATRWKEGVKKIDKPAGETHTHWGDALKYLLYALRESAGEQMSTFNA